MSTRSAIRPPILLAIITGGMIGVGLREVLLLPFSTADGVLTLVVATMVVNVLGSFTLGLVTGSLGMRHPRTRAFVGTGILGGFTTYSAFAVQTSTLISSAPFVGLAFGAVAVLLGLAAAALGLRLITGSASKDADPVVDPGENS